MGENPRKYIFAGREWSTHKSPGARAKKEGLYLRDKKGRAKDEPESGVRSGRAEDKPSNPAEEEASEAASKKLEQENG